MHSTIKTKINIRRLKDFASTKIPRGWILREVILSERDELDAADFVAKVEIWLKPAKLEAVTSGIQRINRTVALPLSLIQMLLLPL